jgi:chemotaxis protein CheD
VNIEELLRSSGLPRAEAVRGDTNSNGLRKVYLHAGQLYASAEPVEIVTILGSCVSICLYDATRGVGGLNHFMLPNDSLNVNPRYVRHATDLLLQQLIAFGAKRSRIEAKVFGGASVLKTGDTGTDLGQRNIEAARERMAQEQFPIVAEDVGGQRGRRLMFLTSDGTALIKQV